MRARGAMALLGLVLMGAAGMLEGCITAHHEKTVVELGDSDHKEVAKWIKVTPIEWRSPLGTNLSFGKLQRCDGPIRPTFFKFEGDFSNCVDLTREEALAWYFGYSQGQGGQIINAGANFAGFAWLANAQNSLSIVNSAAAQSGDVILNIRGHYGK